MCFQISPGTINTSTITSMLIPGITRDQVLSRKVVCDLTLWLNGYSICRNTCLKIKFLLPKTNIYSQLCICFCEKGKEVQPQYFLSVLVSSLNNTDIICPDFCERGLWHCKASSASLLLYDKFLDLLAIIKSQIPKHQMRHLHNCLYLICKCIFTSGCLQQKKQILPSFLQLNLQISLLSSLPFFPLCEGKNKIKKEQSYEEEN